jgi:hypothetical protein
MTPLRFAACGLAFVMIGCLVGCATKGARKPTTHQRQEEAMRDPFRYKPDWSGTDVSGGEMTDLDKQGLQRDLKNVFDP